MRFRRPVIGLATALLAFTACSSGGSSSTPTTTPGPTLATTTTEPSFSSAGSERFCAEERAARDRLNQTSRTGPPNDILRQQYTTTAESLRALAGVAPEEIVNDVRVLSRAYDSLVEALGRANWDPAVVPAELGAKLGTPEIRLASDRLQTYERKVCGIS